MAIAPRLMWPYHSLMKYLVYAFIFFGFSVLVHSGEMDGEGLICNKQGGYGKTYLTPIFFERGVVKDVVVKEYSIVTHPVGDYSSSDLVTTWKLVSENNEVSERLFDEGTGKLSITQHLVESSEPIYSEWECQVTDWAGIEIYMQDEIQRLMEEIAEHEQ